jgi:hypothetical protein
MRGHVASCRQPDHCDVAARPASGPLEAFGHAKRRSSIGRLPTSVVVVVHALRIAECVPERIELRVDQDVSRQREVIEERHGNE